MMTKPFRMSELGSLTLVAALAVAGGAAMGQAPAAPQVNFFPATIQTVAGGGLSIGAGSGDGGLATTASLNGATYTALDSQGNLYIANPNGGGIRKVSAATGVISTVVGSTNSGGGGGVEAAHGRGIAQTIPRGMSVPANQITLYKAGGLAVSASDELYFSDIDNQVIYKLDQLGNVSVVVGTFQSGFSPDGTLATSARVDSPVGLAFDGAGNLYFAERDNDLVRRVNASDGTVTTVAGTQGAAGFTGDGSSALQAQLNYPNGIALDRSGNLFIADEVNSRVRKVVLATGIITTLAGNGNFDYTGDGGPANQAALGGARSVAVDAAGQVYIADADNSIVRLVKLDGTISTVAGTPQAFDVFSGDGGPATQAVFAGVDGVAIDANGSLYVSSDSQRRVYRVGVTGNLAFGDHAAGTSTTLSIAIVNTGAANLTLGASPLSLQSAGFSAGASAVQGCVGGLVLAPGQACNVDVMFSPVAVTSYAGTLNIADDAANSPQAVRLTGTSSLPASQTSLSLSTQQATVGDTVTFQAAVVSQSGSGPAPTGNVLFVDLNTSATLTSGSLDSTGNVAASTSNLAAGLYDVVAQYQGDSTYRASTSADQTLSVQALPTSVALTSSATSITGSAGVTLTASVSSTSSGTPSGLVLFTNGGTVLGSATVVNGTAAATLTGLLPGQYLFVATYVGDTRFVASSSNAVALSVHGALLQFAPGATITFAGIPGNGHTGSFSGDGGPAASASLFTPSGLATDSGGNVYIADEQNNVIRKVAADGTISTVAGVPYAGSIYSTRFGGDGGLATNAYLDNPAAVVVDPAGNLYIADYSNNVVRKVTASTGTITTYAGNNGGPAYTGDSGVATAVGLSHPIALALDNAGDLYIADTGNNLIRKVDPSGMLTTIAGNYYSTPQGSPINGQPATSVPLYQPSGVAISPAGVVYISDTRNGVVRKIDAQGNLITVAGGGSSYTPGDGGPALGAYLNFPGALTFDLAGNLYIVDQLSNAIRRIDPQGTITTVAGIRGGTGSGGSLFDPAGAPATSFNLEAPSGIAVDNAGSLFISDTYNETVLRAGPAGAIWFGPQATGVTSPAQSVTLFNAGDQSVIFGATPYVVTGDYLVAPGSSPCSFTSGLAPGASCNLSIQYSNQTGNLTGAVTFAANTSSPPVIQLKTNSTPTTGSVYLQLSQFTAKIGDNILLYASVSVAGAPATGNIAFYDGTTSLGTVAIASGYATLYVSTFTQGTHYITAVYLGDAVYSTSTSPVQQLAINPPASQTVLTVSSTSIAAGASVSLTATITDSANAAIGMGAVTFYDGGQPLASVTVNASGQAFFTASSLSQGTHTLTAGYQANQSYDSSTSASVVVTVGGGGGGGNTSPFDYVINSLGLPATIHRGDSATLALDVEPVSLVSGTVTPSCGTLPKYATCTFSPTFVNVSASTPSQTVVWTISTTPLP